jgi:predicted RNA-binding Zn ribbon-like protein
MGANGATYVRDDDYPILGEQLATDLVNTWYESDDGPVDYLADLRTARRWAALLDGSPRVDDLRLLRQLRDAVRALFLAVYRHDPVPSRSLTLVNRHAAAACAHLTLVALGPKAHTSRVVFRGPGQLRAKLATSCIEVLTGPHAVRRCAGPGCWMFFVQDHGRRRFCSEGCSHRDRQSRYRRRLS